VSGRQLMREHLLDGIRGLDRRRQVNARFQDATIKRRLETTPP